MMDHRPEPDYPIDSLSLAMRLALMALTDGGKLSMPADHGYFIHVDNRGCIRLPVHLKVTLNALVWRELVTAWKIYEPDGSTWCEARLTGEGAWAIRTLRRKEMQEQVREVLA